MNKPFILTIGDDAPIRNLITIALKTHDCHYLTASTEEAAVLGASSHSPDIVPLDLGLSNMDDVKMIERIRTWSTMSIAVVSARSEDTDKIEALDVRADGCLTKPFLMEELFVRLRAIIRWFVAVHSSSPAGPTFTNRVLRIDFAIGRVYLRGEELHLTPMEYKLLCLPAQNVGKVLTHALITQKTRGSTWDNDIISLRVFVATLRKKIEREPDSPQYIQTHTGVGHRMTKAE